MSTAIAVARLGASTARARRRCCAGGTTCATAQVPMQARPTRQRWRPWAERSWRRTTAERATGGAGVAAGSRSGLAWRRCGDRRGLQEVFAERSFDVGNKLAENRGGCARRRHGFGVHGVAAGLTGWQGWRRGWLGYRAGQEAVAQRGFEIGNKFFENAGSGRAAGSGAFGLDGRRGSLARLQARVSTARLGDDSRQLRSRDSASTAAGSSVGRSFVDLDFDRRNVVGGEFFDHRLGSDRSFFFGRLRGGLDFGAKLGNLASSGVRVWSLASAAMACSGMPWAR